MALCLGDFEFFKIGGFLFVRDLQRQAEPLSVHSEICPIGTTTLENDHLLALLFGPILRWDCGAGRPR